ncbi:MAG TPA: hypothetical protein VMU71_03125 [Terracidiphilus sp.]|nr:hypothetical protein [Terracidiphilus sp.]
MARKKRDRNFEEMLDELRGNGFEVTPDGVAPGGMRVAKAGVAAVLVPGVTDDRWESGGARLAVTPGLVVRGEIARLVDRGYQKFIKTSQYELPATAAQLHAIHAFTEELNQLTGALGLYNEALGTTSDVYLYDRLKGREAEQGQAARPGELAGGH